MGLEHELEGVVVVEAEYMYDMLEVASIKDESVPGITKDDLWFDMLRRRLHSGHNSRYYS